MKDALKDFIQQNREGFKEKPSDELWKKIDASLEKEKNYKLKKRLAMLKYGFGASIVIIAGTITIMNWQNKKTPAVQIKNEKKAETIVETPLNPQTYANTVTLTPAKKTKTVNVFSRSADSLITKPTDTTKEVFKPNNDPPVLYAAHPPVLDTLDITNWPSAGSQRKKYGMSADYSTGKTIGCIKSVSKKINGFITMMQSNVPDKYLGKRVRMTGYLRTESVTEWAGLWMRVGAKGSNEALAFDNMRYGKKDRSVTGTTDRIKYEVVLDVPPNAANIIYGVMLVGTGKIYFDSFILEIVDDTVPLTGGKLDDLIIPKADKEKSYHPRNFWKYYVIGRKISKDGTYNIDLEPNNF